MDGWSAVVASDSSGSGSEVACGAAGEMRVEGVQPVEAERMEDVGSAAVGFGISGIGEGKVVLGRVAHRDDKELRYLHLLWEPGRGEADAAGVASKLGKMSGSRARRQHRAARNLGPIGKDVYAAKRLRDAANSNDIDTVRKLLEEDVDPCAADDKGRTALHFSSCNGNNSIGMEPSLPCFIFFSLVGFVFTSFNDLHRNGTQHHDYCVLGAGPAGLQMGYFLSKAKRNYIILERNSGPGSFFNKYPRHRKLISINKIHTGRRNREFNLRHDWNSLLSDKPDLLFQRVSSEFYPPADKLPLYLSMFERELKLKVQYGVDVGRIRAVQSAAERSYILTDQHGGDYTCSVLLVATGLWVPQVVEFVGSDLVEGYESISTNPEDYKDQAVLILGKGNSAFETAQSILGTASRVHMLSSSPVRLAWQTHYVGDLRAVNNELIDTYQLKSLDGLVEARLEKIVIAERKDQSRRASGGKKKGKGRQFYLMLKKYLQNSQNSSGVTQEELSGYHIDNFPMRKPYDRVIRCLGFRFNFSIFDSSASPPNSENAKGRLPGVTAWYEGKDTPGLFVLGTASHSRDYRASAGGFIHGFRYTARAVHRVLEHRYHGNAWPSTKLSTTQLLSWILKRVSEASGPYQMFEMVGDVILLQGPHCEYVEEFLLQALPQFSTLSGHQISRHGFIVLVMQYGKKKIDYLGRGRAETDWTKAWKSNFLHPVLYYYDRLPTEEEMRMRPHGWPLPRPKAIHHMVEDFLTEWDGPVSHIQPLRSFLEHCVQTDLRAFYAESCFRSVLTHRKPPLFCQEGYLNRQGLSQNSQLLQHVYDTGPPRPQHHDAGSSDVNPAFPSYLAPAGASLSSGLKLDL